MSDSLSSTEALLLTNEMGHLRDDVKRANDTLSAVQQSVSLLPVIQQQQHQFQVELLRGATTMGEQDKRIQTLERDMPALKELRKWVIGGILSGMGMLLAALLKLVIYDPAHVSAPPPPVQQAQGVTK